MRIHKSIFLFSLIFLLALLNSHVFAAEITAFGPRQYVRTTGNPNIYLESFTAEPGEALLVIRNGEPGQKSNYDNRVTSGVISLNGDVLFGHEDFKHQTYILETPITLQESNSLRIELESKPGTYIYLEIIQTVPDPVFDLMASDLQIDTGNCPEYVDINLRITNSGEDEIPGGIQVAFYDGNPEEGGILIGTATNSNQLQPAATEDIALQWNNPSGEEAILYARVDDDGTGTGTYEEVDETNNLIPVETALCRVSAGESSLSGHIIDAVNGNLLANVRTVLYVDDNGTPGAVVTSTESDSEGIFFIPDLAAGSYIIAASHSGYIDNQRSVTVGENVQLANQDLVLSPVLSADEIRIILTWNNSPADLEAHLTEPNETGCRYHCYYFNKITPTASLDLDDRDGYGPETITITDKVPGTYRYYVHDFTNRNINSRWLSLSGAEVKVYSGNKEPLVFTVPYAYGNVWHVFDLDGATGEITPIQIMSRQSEPGRIDYPVITSSAPSKAYWGSTYTYQVRATDPDNDVLTYSLTQAPAGMTIDSETGFIEWTPSGAQSGRYYATVKVEDDRCGEVAQSFSVYVYSEPIAQFSVSPCSGYNPGGTITLSWSTSRVSTVLIDQGIGEVEPSGSLTIPSPEVPTLYTLTAFNDAALVKRTTPAPPGASFYFSPGSITKGQSTTLYWNSQCSTGRSIDHGIGEVPVSGSRVVTPISSGRYYLNAKNAGGSRKHSAYVSVYVPPDHFKIDPLCNFNPGAPMTLSWQINNATDVYISPDVGAVEAAGTYVVYPAQSGSYTLTATVNGNSITRSVSFPDLPTVNISPNNSYAMDLGQTMTLRWWGYCADTVSINQGIGEVPLNGSMSITPETLPQTYTVTATNERGSRSRSVQLYQRLPLVNLSPYPSYGMDLGGSVTLNWSTSYADTISMNQEVGEIEPSGSLTVTPDVLPKTYTVTAANTAGSTVRSVKLYQLPPSGSLSADPTILKVGNSTTLTWTSSRADTCSITPDIGSVGCNGSMLVTPTKPTRYYFNMTGPGGTYRRSVYVSFVPPVADLKASSLTINEGESTQLTWVYANATSCIINQGIGEVELGGERTVSPTITTTYTMTATGPGGTATDQVTITVIPTNPPPTLNLSVSDSFIVRGEPTILAWEGSYADSVVISPEVGVVPVSGTATVTPEVTTTYTATATGPGGATTAKITVMVVPPSPTVNLTAVPLSIMADESATLSWTSSDADTVRFDQGIGSAPLEGSLTVSPIETTTYTLTATGPGGSTTKSVTLTVSYPEPVVSFSATPLSITMGETVTLIWTTTDADSVVIEPGIGTVMPNSSITVAPTETTTYTISATGPGGTANSTATVTVIYPVPTVAVSANPSTIQLGESATLSWTTYDAESVAIEPDIGVQPANGEVTVSPDTTTAFTITAVGPGGCVSETVTITVAEPSPITLTITSPVSGATINRAEIMVTGTINHKNSIETGVVVNGVGALVYNDTYVANHVPLFEGDNTITVVGTDEDGKTNQVSVTVTATLPTDAIMLGCNYAFSLAPLNATLQVAASFGTSSEPSFFYTGPGEVVFIQNGNEKIIDISMSVPGFYYFTAELSALNGDQYAAELAVLVLDRQQLDTRLREKWEGMKSALISGNIQDALSFHHPSVRSEYEIIYSALGDQIANLVGQMQNIELIFSENGQAKYRIRKEQIIDGNPENITYYIYFFMDGNGIWRIENY
ncbi:MAG: putative Ig domain-containing protein [Desulfobulbaceae bacterium]|nr:putative Ig domain-containing protein [Desulfobulbaceae bacterium]